MKLLINIPKEFEQHFQADRFEESLHRLSADAHLLAGLYEQETALMLSEAFKNAVPVLSRGRLIDASKIGLTDFEIILCQEGNSFKNALEMLLEKIENAPTIIPASEEDE